MRDAKGPPNAVREGPRAPRSPRMAGGRGSIGGDGRLSIVVGRRRRQPHHSSPFPLQQCTHIVTSSSCIVHSIDSHSQETLQAIASFIISWAHALAADRVFIPRCASIPIWFVDQTRNEIVIVSKIRNGKDSSREAGRQSDHFERETSELRRGRPKTRAAGTSVAAHKN